MMMRAVLIVTPALVLAATPAVMAQDAPSPAGQVYAMGSQGMGARGGYRVSFDADGSLSISFRGTYPPSALGREGQWTQDADGAVTITGEDLPLFELGSDSVRCDAWPGLEVGAYFDELPCWWAGMEPDGPLQRIE